MLKHVPPPETHIKTNPVVTQPFLCISSYVFQLDLTEVHSIVLCPALFEEKEYLYDE